MMVGCQGGLEGRVLPTITRGIGELERDGSRLYSGDDAVRS